VERVWFANINAKDGCHYMGLATMTAMVAANQLT
jgi:hypothetical protein